MPRRTGFRIGLQMTVKQIHTGFHAWDSFDTVYIQRACKLLSGQASPSSAQGALQASRELPAFLLNQHPHVFVLYRAAQSRPMGTDLVGLSGGLEGRVAGVVLVLVGCKTENCRSVICSVQGILTNCRDFGWSSYPVSSIHSSSFAEPSIRTRGNRSGGLNVLAARVVARELMPYAMIRPVVCALAPLSRSISSPRACSRSHPTRVVGS